MGAMSYQITGVSIVCSTVCSDADQRKHRSSASLAFVRGVHWWQVYSPHRGPVTGRHFHLMTSSWNKVNIEAFSDVVTITGSELLTHWGRVTHICVGNLNTIGSDNGLSPGRHQAITWTNVGILLIGPLWTNFSELFIEILTFSFKKIHLKMSSGKWWPFCLGLNVLKLISMLCLVSRTRFTGLIGLPNPSSRPTNLMAITWAV